MMAKPMKTLELYYPMIRFLITRNIPLSRSNAPGITLDVLQCEDDYIEVSQLIQIVSKLV